MKGWAGLATGTALQGSPVQTPHLALRPDVIFKFNLGRQVTGAAWAGSTIRRLGEVSEYVVTMPAALVSSKPRSNYRLKNA
jgi:hypothetical protein